MDKPSFITFEGTEGSGKTTVALKCVKRLNMEGIESVYVQDPGGCPVSEQIRSILLHTDNQMSSETELLLFCAARSEMVASVIVPALEQGKVVISDRYIDSTVAYQGYGRGVDANKIEILNSIVTRGLVPCKTFLLDLPVEIGLTRQTLLDRISEEDLYFHQRVREGFLSCASTSPDRFQIIDASQPLDHVVNNVWETLLQVIKQRV